VSNSSRTWVRVSAELVQPISGSIWRGTAASCSSTHSLVRAVPDCMAVLAGLKMRAVMCRGLARFDEMWSDSSLVGGGKQAGASTGLRMPSASQTEVPAWGPLLPSGALQLGIEMLLHGPAEAEVRDQRPSLGHVQRPGHDLGLENRYPADTDA